MEEHRLTVDRTARLVTLGPLDTAVREVWVALHGQGQLAPRFARRLQPLDDGSRLIVLPEGLSRYYVNEAERLVGASWMTTEGRLDEIADYVRYLDQITRWLPETAVAAPRTVLGFSQGSATAWRWVTQGSTPPPARLIIWGGEVPPDLDLGLAAERLQRTRVELVAGATDPYCTPDRLTRYADQLTRAGIAVVAVAAEGGHDVDPTTLAALAG